MAGNIFQDGMDAFNGTTDAIEHIQKRRAQYQAAPMVAAGNFTGAAKAYGASGLPDEARQSVVDQQAMDARAKQQALEDSQRKADALLKVSKGLRAVPMGERKAALDTLTPLWQKLNIDPSMFNQLDEAHLTDESLDAFDASLGKAAEEYTLGAGDRRFRGSTEIAHGAPKPLEMDPAKNYYMPDAGAPTDQPASPAPAASLAQQGPTNGSALQPRGLRNNNPLNITSLGGGQQWDGQAGSDGQYAKFGTMDQGLAAADKNLQAYGTRHGINTVAGVIQRWAPQGKDGNPTAAYIATVSKDLGIDPNQTIDLTNPQVRKAVLRSMAKVELGQPLPAASSAAPAATQPASAAPSSVPGYRLIQQAKPQWQDMPDGRQRNVFTGKVEGTAKGEDDAPLTPDAVDLMAGKYLSSGQLPPMGMGKTGTRNRTLILNRATTMAKGLGLDANDLVAGSMNVKAAGAALNKATALRSQVEGAEHTVLKNAQYALQLAQKGGGPTGIPVLNRWIQSGKKNLAGDADVAAFHTAIGTVADEYAKVMTASSGSGGTTSDSARLEAYRRISAASTPQQLQAIIGAMQTEMANRVDSMREVENGLRSNIRAGSGGQSALAPVATPAPAASGSGWKVVKVH